MKARSIHYNINNEQDLRNAQQISREERESIEYFQYFKDLMMLEYLHFYLDLRLFDGTLFHPDVCNRTDISLSQPSYKTGRRQLLQYRAVYRTAKELNSSYLRDSDKYCHNNYVQVGLQTSTGLCITYLWQLVTATYMTPLSSFSDNY